MARPIAADKAGANDYVPLYSYSRATAFRHTDKAGLTADVAGKAPLELHASLSAPFC